MKTPMLTRIPIVTHLAFDRLSILFPSSSRPGVFHLVDFEGDANDPVICTCEAFTIGKERPCKHIRNATIPML